jgi:hypothetical protein
VINGLQYDHVAWREGYEAAARGVAHQNNPYTPGDGYAIAWRAGYDTRNCDGAERCSWRLVPSAGMGLLA